MIVEAMITFANVGINYITESLEIKKNQNHRNAPIIGQDGSDIAFVSSDAHVITFKSLCLPDELSTDGSTNRINEYIALSQTYNKTPAALAMDSVTKDNVNGDYYITGFDYSEDTTGTFSINWEFTKQVKFNVTQKTFRVWNKAQALSNAKKKSSKGLSSTTKKLLKDCGTMKKGSTGNCVKCLQTFLQSQGYYTKYKVDGNYQEHTVSAVKALQKKYNIYEEKGNGIWGIITRAVFQKKYKYPPKQTHKFPTSFSDKDINKAIKQGKKLFK